MSGNGLRTWNRPAKEYYRYREENTDFDIDKLKEMQDDDNEQMDSEWFSDGQWEMDDEQADIEEEDWEEWDDWFPPEEKKI